jgi:hypothetical protein
MVFSRIGVSGKAAQIWEEGNGSSEREGEQDGVGKVGRARSVLGANPISVTAPKC